VLTNVAGHNALYTALGTRILSAFLGGPTRDWSAISLASAAREEERAAERVQSQMRQRVADSRPSRALGEYAGTYRHAMYGDVTVTLEGDALAVRYPNAVDLRLEHFTFDTFLGHEKGSSLLASEALPVRFSLDALGRVSAMELTGVETFTRVRP
jgi:hypothetical protein